MNILFCLYGDFASNSAQHVAQLAGKLKARGHDCVVAVPTGLPSLNALHRVDFTAVEFSSLFAGPSRFRNREGPEIIHAWTTRESIRRFLDQYLPGQASARLIVHLEDDEAFLTEAALGATTAALGGLSDDELDARCGLALTHPQRGPILLRAAAGVTTIIDTLFAQAPADLPKHFIWPAADESFFIAQPRRENLRAELGLSPETLVLFYHGNTHAANARDMRSLYLAVALLNRQGVPTRLIRCGSDSVSFLGEDDSWCRQWVLPLGHVQKQSQLPGLMSLADAFVQPGAPGRFNDFRFPSKLPEFFSIGRPVILPRTNLGLKVEHLQDAYVLDRADGESIARALTHLRGDPALATRLGEGALAYARRHFNWTESAARLESFYAQVIGSTGRRK
jgi:glycosyltransferase involved in cell wall biosynthesis